MKIELRKISYNARLSQETMAFAADIWIDGKKVGDASNQGHGGPTDYHIVPAELRIQAEAYAKSLPPIKGPDYQLDMDLELLIGELLSDYVEAKRNVRLCKKNIVMQFKGDRKGDYRSVKKLNGVYSLAQKQRLIQQYGDKIESFVNETLGETPQ